MSKTELLEKLALFYYFFFLDEVKAQTATVKTVKKIKIEKISRPDSDASLSARELVSITNNFLEKSSKNAKPVSLAYSSGYIILPERSNWGPWFELKKVASEKDFRALLYAKILKISETDIAAGLGVPLGTIRYRLGRALKTLGFICQQGAQNNELR